MLHISPDLADAVDGAALAADLDRVRASVSDALGVLVPEVGITLAPSLSGPHFRIDVEGVPVEEDEARPAHLLLRDDPANVELLGLPFERQEGSGTDIPDRIWIADQDRPKLEQAGIGHLDCGQVMAARVGEVVSRFAPRFLGIQETKALLACHESRYGDLLKEVLRTLSIQKVADVLRRLLEEGIAIRNMRLILEALAEWGEKEGNVVLLTEYVRSALKRQICHRYANGHKVVAAYVLERATEDVLRTGVRDTAVGPYLVLDEQNAERLLAQGRRIKTNVASDQVQPVVLSSVDIRRFVRGFLARNGLDIPILSYQDLANDFTVQPVGSISLVGDVPAQSGVAERIPAREMVASRA
jgi:type III secretion protein V